MNTQWHTSPKDQAAFEMISKALAPVLLQLTPYHELTHIGIRTDEVKDKHVILLHLAPIGTVRVVPETEAIPPTQYLLEKT